MQPNSEENKIRELFGELRQREGGRVPDFDTVWAHASARAKRERHQHLALLIAIGAIVAVVGMIFGVSVIRERRMAGVSPTHSRVATAQASLDLPWKTSVLICEWRSPTDFLLQSPNTLPTEFLIDKPRK
jgi:hypothetical protein